VKVPPFASLLAALGAAAFAHELDVVPSIAAPAVVLRCTYAGRDPVSFAAVQVYAPASSQAEFQTGRTDRHGVFSFVPDEPGSWRVVVDDEEGHRRDVSVTVPSNLAASGVAAPPQGPPVARWERAITGLALMAGATGVLYGFKARRGS